MTMAGSTMSERGLDSVALEVRFAVDEINTSRGFQIQGDDLPYEIRHCRQ